MIKRIKCGQKVFGVDIDETLVLMEIFENGIPDWVDPKSILWLTSKTGVKVPTLPHARHIAIVKQFAARDFTLVAWSAGGEEWAYKVVMALGLEHEFTYSMSKFDWIMDDKPASAFLPETNRIYRHLFDKLKDSGPKLDEIE